MQIPNMTIVFSNSSPKIEYAKEDFWSQIQAFFRGVGFKHDNIVFKFQPKNIQISHFWSQTQAFQFFSKILQLDKFEGADFKYDNSFFKFQPKSTQIRQFSSQIQTFWGVFVKFCHQTNSRVLISNMTIQFFQILAQKYSNKTIFFLHFFSHKIFFLQKISHFDKLKVLKPSMAIVFSSSSLGIFSAKFEVLSSDMKLCMNLRI